MDRTDKLVIIGFGVFILGLFMAWQPLALIVGGLSIAVVAAWYDVRKRGK
jgi:hypothetical protein